MFKCRVSPQTWRGHIVLWYWWGVLHITQIEKRFDFILKQAPRMEVESQSTILFRTCMSRAFCCNGIKTAKKKESIVTRTQGTHGQSGSETGKQMSNIRIINKWSIIRILKIEFFLEWWRQYSQFADNIHLLIETCSVEIRLGVIFRKLWDTEY